ncbi:MAG: Lrp/AsnC ligand binding domain-containing protein [Candidatus Thorarchaeota archaeon]|nr:Lrp/AsnC ligand binding domain-containing protein [Candidatus Thorarchaeota archaeon]
MSSTTQRPVSRWPAGTVFYLLALGSGVMRTLSIATDYVALGEFDPLVFGFVAQWVSFLVTLTTVLFLSLKKRHGTARRPLGYSLDPDFGRLSLLPRKPMQYVLLAGFFAGVSTACYFFLIGFTDASAVLPYGQLVIIYLLIGDLLAEKDTPTIIEIQCIISILFGALLVGMTPEGFESPYFLVTLLIVLGPLNLSSALITYYQKKAKRYEVAPGLKVDALNMRVWSLFVLNSVFTLLILPVVTPEQWATVPLVTPTMIVWMAIGSLATFLSIVLYIRALARGSMAIVNSLTSISVVLGIPVSVIGSLTLPGSFGPITSDPTTWILRTFGVILVVVGIVALEGSDVRSIILIRTKSNAGDLLPALFSVKGVESASALAGREDYLLSVRSRSLAKTRKLVLKKIQQIEGVNTIQTLVVLKEYR